MLSGPLNSCLSFSHVCLAFTASYDLKDENRHVTEEARDMYEYLITMIYSVGVGFLLGG